MQLGEETVFEDVCTGIGARGGCGFDVGACHV